MNLALLAIMLVAGCASSYQSARVVPVGKTEVTVALSRISDVTHDEQVSPQWTGDVQIRRGLMHDFDAGLRYVRTPGVSQYPGLAGAPPGVDQVFSSLSVDPKLQVAEAQHVVVSVALPLHLGWQHDYQRRGSGTLAFVPVLFVGFQIAPSLEIVLAGRVGARKFLCLDCRTNPSRFEAGGSIGLRFGHRAAGWAIQPELGVLRLYHDSDDQRGVLVSFGIAVSAGN